VLIADGGRVLADLATLRDPAQLYGPVASDPTLWRTLSEIGAPQRRKIPRARHDPRSCVVADRSTARTDPAVEGG
jgi:hypothetical protein